jgi:hypothetical protein
MTELRVLLDLNIVMDVLARRQLFYENSAKVWAAAESGWVEGYIAAHSLTNIYYLLNRHCARKEAALAVADLMRVFSVATVGRDVLYQALTLGWKDFENAVQVVAAAQAGATFIVTRSPADYPNSPVPLISPGELLTNLQVK